MPDCWSLDEIAPVRKATVTAEKRTSAETPDNNPRVNIARERPALLAFARAAVRHRPVEIGQGAPDCHVAIDRVLYSVPWQHVGKSLQAKIGTTLVELFDGDERVKTHVRADRGRQTDQAELPPDKVAFLMRWVGHEADQREARQGDENAQVLYGIQ